MIRSMTIVTIAALVATGLAAAPADARPGAAPEIARIAAPTTRASSTVPAAKAATGVVIGQHTDYTMLGGCPSGPHAVAQVTSGGGASYTMPTAGVITSWSTSGGGAAGDARPLLFVDGAAGHKTLVGKGDFVAVPITYGVAYTFPVRISVQAGWQLGLGTSTSGQACALYTSFAGDVIARGGFNADTTTDLTYATQAGIRPDISAVLEPDVDGDGYGDVTQDPVLTLTKQPKPKSPRRKAVFKFTSSIAGSTFTCAVDGKAAKPCTSPFKKRVRYGKHTVVITATSPAGGVGAPVTVKFKVKKRR
jgi:hypothetical protein